MRGLNSPLHRRISAALALAGASALALGCSFGGGGTGGSDEPAPFPSVLNVQEAAGGTVGLATGEGNAVTLTAEPDEGYAFSKWECPVAAMCPAGADGGAMAEITVLVSRDLTVAPVFARQVMLRLEGGENGRATADCEPDCVLDAGAAVVLRAIADEGFRFRRWDCEGGGVCSSFDRSSSTPAVMVTGDVTLTPLFERRPEVTLAVQDGVGGTIVLDVECGEGCTEDGIGWGAEVRAVPDAGYLFDGWRCVGAALCPSEVEDEAGSTLEFVPEASLVITADFRESSFSIVSKSVFDFSTVSRSVEQQALCNAPNDCVFLVGGTSALLRASGEAEEGQVYAWRVAGDAAHLMLEDEDGGEVRVRGSNDISEILVSTVEVTTMVADGAQELSDTLTVVAVPPALAVQVGSGCSGSVIENGGQHYVLTAAHCLLEFSRDDEDFFRDIAADSYAVTLFTRDGGREFTAPLFGVDDITDVGLLEIPDPELGWVPEIGSFSAVGLGAAVRTVGGPQSADALLSAGNNGLVTQGEVRGTESLVCEDRMEELEAIEASEGGFAVGPFTDCDQVDLHVVPDFAAPGSSGGPIIDDANRIIGVLTGGSVVAQSEPVAAGALLDGVDSLAELLAGGRRCSVRVGKPGDDSGQLFFSGVDDCSGGE